ncbi:ubiquitin-like protein Atg12, partial [Tribonema minus]
VRIHFMPISNAPILRQTKFRVPGSWTFQDLQASLRTQLKLPSSTPLFVYCNSAFCPSPDQILIELFLCFGTGGELVINYSLSEAWG